MNGKEKIIEKLELLEKYVTYLESQKSISKKKLNEDYTLLSSIERNFQLAIESVLSIGEMIISERKLKKPEAYKEVIQILGGSGILPKPFAEKFAPVAGFRNILIHRYADVDTDELYNHLKNDVVDFRIFMRHIAHYLKK